MIEGPASEIENPKYNDNLLYVRNNDFFERTERKTDITYLNYQSFLLYKSKYSKCYDKWKYICMKRADENFKL